MLFKIYESRSTNYKKKKGVTPGINAIVIYLEFVKEKLEDTREVNRNAVATTMIWLYPLTLKDIAIQASPESSASLRIY